MAGVPPWCDRAEKSREPKAKNTLLYQKGKFFMVFSLCLTAKVVLLFASVTTFMLIASIQGIFLLHSSVKKRPLRVYYLYCFVLKLQLIPLHLGLKCYFSTISLLLTYWQKLDCA